MISKYSNTLSQIPLTVVEIEKQLETYDLEFSAIRNTRVEGFTNAPIFLYSFYAFLINSNRIPTQQEYWENYVGRAKEWLEQHGFDSTNPNRLNALKARAYRAYPSFVRDIHFCKLLESTKKYTKVFYNENLDMKDGIDIVVEKNDKLYCIHLFVKTSISKGWKEKKQKRHDFTDIEQIDLSIDFKKAIPCGKFFLCGNDELIKIEAYIAKKERII